MITGQRRAGEIVEAARTCFAPVALGAAVYRRSQGSKRHLASGADAPARSTWHHPAALSSPLRNLRGEAQRLHKSFEQWEGDFHVLSARPGQRKTRGRPQHTANGGDRIAEGWFGLIV